MSLMIIDVRMDAFYVDLVSWENLGDLGLVASQYGSIYSICEQVPCDF